MRVTCRLFWAVVALAVTGGIWVPAASAEDATWGNTSPITFAGLNQPGPGSSYPSAIQVSGHEGPITDVDLHVNGIDMADLGHLSLLLVSPSGETEIAKRARCLDVAANDMNLIFDQQAPAELENFSCPGGRYRPSDGCPPGCTTDNWPGGPAGPHTGNFDNFDNENANGVWRLYAYRSCVDGCPATGDQIGQGWSIEIETGPFNLDLPAGGAGTTFGPASPYPSTLTVAGRSGVVTDVNVRLNGIFHTHPDDIEMMLEKAGGPKVMLMSDACGSFDVNAYGWLWDDEAAAVMPNDGSTNVCGTQSHRPTDHDPGENLPAPAPPGPYATSLSAFDLTDPNGDYRLWVADDASGDEGFYTNQFTLDIGTRAPASTAFVSPAYDAPEGAPEPLTVRRSGANAYAPATVDVTSSPGTASAADFTPVSRTLEFAANETEKLVSVDATADGETEGVETFTVSLSAPSGDADLGSPATTTVTIPANATDAGSAPGGDQSPQPPSADTLAPETQIAKSPKRTTPKRRAKFAFTSTEPGSTFECQRDKRPFRPCNSPTKLRKVDPGRHRFRVRAIDATGNADPTPAKARWKVLQ